MRKRRHFLIWLGALFGVLFVVLAAQAGPMVNKDSVEPGSKISMKGTPFSLMGTPIIVGKPLPAAVLTDAMQMKGVDLSMEKGSVLFLVLYRPSIRRFVMHKPTIWEKRVIGCHLQYDALQSAATHLLHRIGLPRKRSLRIFDIYLITKKGNLADRPVFSSMT